MVVTIALAFVCAAIILFYEIVRISDARKTKDCKAVIEEQEAIIEKLKKERAVTIKHIDAAKRELSMARPEVKIASWTSNG